MHRNHRGVANSSVCACLMLANACLHEMMNSEDRARERDTACRTQKYPKHNGMVFRVCDVIVTDIVRLRSQACATNPSIAAMHANPLCQEWAEQHGRPSDSLWDKYTYVV